MNERSDSNEKSHSRCYLVAYDKGGVQSRGKAVLAGKESRAMAGASTKTTKRKEKIMNIVELNKRLFDLRGITPVNRVKLREAIARLRPDYGFDNSIRPEPPMPSEAKRSKEPDINEEEVRVILSDLESMPFDDFRKKWKGNPLVEAFGKLFGMESPEPGILR